MAKDAEYRGINLLKDETLTTYFNEDYTRFLETKGIDATQAGLGIQNADFGFLSRLHASRDQISNARKLLRNYTSSLQSNLSIITTHKDFIQKSINTLQDGRDDLVLADQNKEGANLLALQVRQQIQFQVLALSRTAVAEFA